MLLRYSFLTAVRGLRTNKSRSALTILGIVIGITAIILVMSLGRGAQTLILSQIQGMGSRTIVVIPGREPRGPSDAAQIFSDSLKPKDFAAIRRRENVPTAADVMPLIFGGEAASFGSETYRLTIFGASELIAPMFDLTTAAGSFFTADDVRSRADVVVIGAKVKRELFGAADAVGEKIKIKGRNLRVAGVLPAKGQVSFFNFDETAIVPYPTAQQYIFGIKHFHRFIISAASEAGLTRTVRDLEATLRESHGITDPEKDDFFVETQADLAARFSAITSVLTLFLAAVAAISLVVGGIGIMNIMLVAVTERTREIGLRKAVGATERDILTQFLFESTLLTGIGGIVGILLGLLLAFGSAVALRRAVGLAWTFVVPVPAVILGVGVSTLVGVVFGLYPASKAARKNPIEALRYE